MQVNQKILFMAIGMGMVLPSQMMGVSFKKLQENPNNDTIQNQAPSSLDGQILNELLDSNSRFRDSVRQQEEVTQKLQKKQSKLEDEQLQLLGMVCELNIRNKQISESYEQKITELQKTTNQQMLNLVRTMKQLNEKIIDQQKELNDQRELSLKRNIALRKLRREAKKTGNNQGEQFVQQIDKLNETREELKKRDQQYQALRRAFSKQENQLCLTSKNLDEKNKAFDLKEQERGSLETTLKERDQKINQLDKVVEKQKKEISELENSLLAEQMSSMLNINITKFLNEYLQSQNTQSTLASNILKEFVQAYNEKINN